jgi:hypothetical protein
MDRVLCTDVPETNLSVPPCCTPCHQDDLDGYGNLIVSNHLIACCTIGAYLHEKLGDDYDEASSEVLREALGIPARDGA